LKHRRFAAGGRSRRRGLAVALVAGLVLIGAAGSAQTAESPGSAGRIEISAQRLAGFDHGDPSRRRLGARIPRRTGLTSRFKSSAGFRHSGAADGAHFMCDRTRAGAARPLYL